MVTCSHTRGERTHSRDASLEEHTPAPLCALLRFKVGNWLDIWSQETSQTSEAAQCTVTQLKLRPDTGRVTSASAKSKLIWSHSKLCSYEKNIRDLQITLTIINWLNSYLPIWVIFSTSSFLFRKWHQLRLVKVQSLVESKTLNTQLNVWKGKCTLQLAG